MIEGGIRERPKFFAKNEATREETESEIARRRQGSAVLIEDTLFEFYRQRLRAVGSFPELKRFAKQKHGGSFDFLEACIEDLIPPDETAPSVEDFPKSVKIGGSVLPLFYRHDPGHDADGVTIRVPISQIGTVRQAMVDWAVPGHLEEKIESLLRGLPKAIRVRLHPLKERSHELSQLIKPSDRSLRDCLAEVINERCGVITYRDDWVKSEIPKHLQPRIEITNTKQEILAEGRDLDTLRKRVETQAKEFAAGSGLETIPAWQTATARYEKENVSGWTFGDLPELIDLTGDAGLPLKAYPALLLTENTVSLRLLSSEAEAFKATRIAWPVLGEIVAGRNLSWLRRDLKDLKQLGALLLPLGSLDTIKDSAWRMLRRHLFRSNAMLPLKQKEFERVVNRAEQERRGILTELQKRLQALLEARQAVSFLLEKKKTPKAICYPGMRIQLDRIAPSQLLDHFEFDELPNLTRYLTAMRIRAERAKENVSRDMEKAKRTAPFEVAYEGLLKAAKTDQQKQLARDYHLLLEEFKVSVFAQELGTAQKVSEKRLEKLSESFRLL